jgi:4-hydroxy-2-oxoheptanedioate aldolase
MTSVRSVREIIAEKGHVLSSYCQMPGAFAAEVYARQGWDAVTLDMQHGMISFPDALAMLQSMSASGVTPLVRVPTLDPALIMQLLDAGVMGIVCAMINTPEDARRLVEICRYPPLGARSFGPARASLLYGSDYGRRANTDIAVFAMVETQEAVRNLDGILAVEGIDGVYIGPGDLALSMGVPAEPSARTAAVDDAIALTLSKCVSRGLIAGMLAPDAKAAWDLVGRGCSFITLASDLQALRQQARGWVSDFRALASGGTAEREN